MATYNTEFDELCFTGTMDEEPDNMENLVIHSDNAMNEAFDEINRPYWEQYTTD